MNEFWAAVWAVVWKDLQIEGRTRQTVSVMVMFSLATIIMFNFALGMAVNVNLSAGRDVAPALFWAIVLLAAILGLNRSLALDRENQVFDALLIAPIPRTALYVGKVISVTLFTLLLDAILVVLFTVFFNQPFYLPVVLLVVVLGTVGYVIVGVLITSMTIQSRTREVLLPVLLLPVSLPLVLPAAMATATYIASAMSGEASWALVQAPVLLVIAYDLLMLGVGLFAYQFVVES
ncbi:MAG: heme exporter protein CcmB [Anaerolineae bacterium]|uniref:heme exporter protein CcmB n=1 Tax=Promineifilum sp. TaxID=2664178 RepID=UPI001DAD0742|nr:heme exporter protein CcmB [Anaerolineales bacterium]MCB8934456.1 heme exporter protein CcmB [Promineifilum sp.]MCO5179974.1 heme exporter protein CcmB [Promineifilum sp.]MCW5847134.1 heme exporter protein CcmB [Anaerolineae bacterium]